MSRTETGPAGLEHMDAVPGMFFLTVDKVKKGLELFVIHLAKIATSGSVPSAGKIAVQMDSVTTGLSARSLVLTVEDGAVVISKMDTRNGAGFGTQHVILAFSPLDAAFVRQFARTTW